MNKNLHITECMGQEKVNPNYTFSTMDDNKIRAVELKNGLSFGVINSKTNEWEYFEFQDGEYLGLEEYTYINEFGEEVKGYNRTGDVFDQDYIVSLRK